MFPQIKTKAQCLRLFATSEIGLGYACERQKRYVISPCTILHLLLLFYFFVLGKKEDYFLFPFSSYGNCVYCHCLLLDRLVIPLLVFPLSLLF